MQVKDLVVTGDVRVLGSLYTKDAVNTVQMLSPGGDILTYTLVKNGTSLTLLGSDGSTSVISPIDPAYFMNRSTAVTVADTNYTSLMARGSSLHSSATNPSVNGAICWRYE
jgi:hypothetical protein